MFFEFSFSLQCSFFLVIIFLSLQRYGLVVKRPRVNQVDRDLNLTETNTTPMILWTIIVIQFCWFSSEKLVQCTMRKDETRSIRSSTGAGGGVCWEWHGLPRGKSYSELTGTLEQVISRQKMTYFISVSARMTRHEGR